MTSAAVPPASPRLTDDQLAVIAVRLALRFPLWMQRRVEHVSYLDDITVGHAEGVMLRWPEPDFFPEGAQPETGQTLYVPLDLLTKDPLVGLDGVRPDGTPFPILPFGRTTALAAAGITAFIWGLSEQMRGAGLGDASRQIIDAAVRSPPPLARQALRILDDRTSELGTLLRENELRGLLQELGDRVLLLAPAVYEAGAEAVYRYTYSEPLPWTRSRHPLREQLGFADVHAGIRSLSLGWSASYHLAVEAPAEVRLTRARLYGVYDRDRPVTALIAEDGGSPVVDLHARRPTPNALAAPNPARPPSRPPILPVPVDSTAAAALAAALDSTPTVVDRSDHGFANLRFRPSPTGTFLAATVVSSLTALQLILDSIQLAALDATISTPLLLALPVLALGYLTRPGEHSFATRLLQGVRLEALGVGICALLVAVLLGGGFIRHPPSPAPDYRCARVAPAAKAPPAGATRCASQRVRTPRPVVPTAVRDIVFLATLLAAVLAVLLVAGWLSTRGRPSGRLPPPKTAREAT